MRHEAERRARGSTSSPFPEVISIGEGFREEKLTIKLVSDDEMDGKKEVVFESPVEMTMISCQVWRSSIL